MARAYASGKTPRLLRVAPDGMNEVWVLDDVAFVVPVVPPDAPPLLEYALRLRREALLCGVCDQCGSTFDLDSPQETYSSNVSSAIFSHRNNCPATDEDIIPLLDEYIKQRNATDIKDEMKSASRRTREKMLARLDNRIDVDVTSEVESKANELLGEKLSRSPVKICGHLRTAPAQTWHLYLWDDTWRCDECVLYFSETVRRGAFRLSDLEDHSCDFCNRYAPTTLTPMVMRVGMYIMHGAICRRCGRNWGYTEQARSEVNR